MIIHTAVNGQVVSTTAKVPPPGWPVLSSGFATT
jgi:hypothetical protein